MAKVNFKTGLKSAYTNLAAKDSNTLYFLTDTREIYKGESLYSEGKFRIVDALPTSNQEQGVVYFVISTKTGSVWNGTGWSPVIQDTDAHSSKKAGTAAADAGHVYVDDTTMKVASDGKLSVGEVPESSVTGLTDKLGDLAPKANPTFTGTVTLPEDAPAADTQAVNKKYVDDQDKATLDSAKEYANGILGANDAMLYKGTVDSEADLPAEHKVGWTYKVTTAGTYVGQECEIGDMIICVTKGTTANSADWTVVQNNIDGAVIGPVSAVANRVATFDGITGKLIKDSGYTIASDVPQDAKFTDTTYTVDAPASKTNGNVTIDLSDGTSKDSISIKGTGATSVTTDESGVIAIDSTDSDTTYTMAATAKTGGGATVTLTPSDGTATTFDVVGGDDIEVSVESGVITIASTVAIPIASQILMTGYTKATAAAAVSASDDVSTAIGKLEKLLDEKAETSHNQASSTIDAMTGYTKGSAATAITASDTLNAAIAKLENKADNANAALEWGTI